MPPTHKPFADEELADFINSFAAQPLMSATNDITELRRVTAKRSAQRPSGPDLATLDIVLANGHFGARFYCPDAASDALTVFLHGGGWTIGDLDSHDRACRRLAARSQIPVLAIDYRLAPEHPATASVDDTVDALAWVASGPDALGGRPAVTVVAGDSAGGTLAALAALRVRGTDAAPDLLAMLYATTDLTATGGSMVDNAHGYGLDIDDIEWFNRQWVPDQARWSDSDISPMMAEDLSGLPQTLIVTGELDPLRDQAEAFAARLDEAGVAVTTRCEAGMVHNFLLWDLISPACAAAGDRIADDIATAVGMRVAAPPQRRARASRRSH